MSILNCCSNDHETCQYNLNNLNHISVNARYLFGTVSLSNCIDVLLYFI